MTTPTNPSTANIPSERERPDNQLARRYGKIGISAVAAALRYQEPARNNVNLNVKATAPKGNARAA